MTEETKQNEELEINENSLKAAFHKKAVSNSRKFGFDQSGVVTSRRNKLLEIFEDEFKEFEKLREKNEDNLSQG